MSFMSASRPAIHVARTDPARHAGRPAGTVAGPDVVPGVAPDVSGTCAGWRTCGYVRFGPFRPFRPFRPLRRRTPRRRPSPHDPQLADSARRSSTALVILATLASLYTLHLARDFIVPVVVAIVIAYLLDPMVEWLQRQHMPRAVGATLVLLGMLAVLLCGAYLLRSQVETIVDRLPAIASKLSRSLGELVSGDDSMLQKIRRATTVLAGTGQPPPPRARRSSWIAPPTRSTTPSGWARWGSSPCWRRPLSCCS